MGQIMKAQLYQLKRNKLNYVVFVGLVFMQCTTLLGEIGFSSTTVTAGSYVAANGGYIMSVALMFALMLTGSICGEDFIDKTVNYELMSGHLRRELYFGRAVLSLLIGTAGTIILNIVPVAVACIMNGWGDELSAWEVFLRYILSVLPVLRLVCEFVFISYIVKNSYAVMALGFVVSMAGSAWMELFKAGDFIFLGTGNLQMLFDFTSWSTYTLAGEKEIMVYDAVLSAGDVAGTVLASVLIGGLFLILGYLYFEEDDLN